MSRSVCTLASTCSRVPHGTVETEFPHPAIASDKPLGEYALPCEILRWLLRTVSLVNTVVFLPTALRCRTRTLFSCQSTTATFYLSGRKAERCPGTFLFIPAMNGRGFLKRMAVKITRGKTQSSSKKSENMEYTSFCRLSSTIGTKGILKCGTAARSL